MLQALIFITIILLAMMGNLLVIVSVLRTKNLRRQKAYYFVVSLAVAGDEIGIIEGKFIEIFCRLAGVSRCYGRCKTLNFYVIKKPPVCTREQSSVVSYSLSIHYSTNSISIPNEIPYHI